MQGHIHAESGRDPVDHGDRRLAHVGDVAHQLGQAIEETLAGGVEAASFIGGVAEVVVVRFEVTQIRSAHVGAGAKPPADAGQHNHLDVRIVVCGAHVLADLGQRAGPLGAAHGSVELLRPIEPDPEDAVVFLLIEQIGDELELLHRILL